MTSDVYTAYQILVDRLRAMQTNEGYWTGRLSNSALSTATAISGLAVSLREYQVNSIGLDANVQLDVPARWIELIERGSDYLTTTQNGDGGFGDTDRSNSNIATTLLVIAAWRLAGKQTALASRIRDAEAYVERHGKWDGLRRRYGKDKTFVVPILSNCALAGMVAWTEVIPLPFEAAALPQSWYRFAQMPVVSYAVPALVAIGQARYVHAPPRNPLIWLIRRSVLNRTRTVLRKMQPDSGGYLEATPLTSFVLMNLASIGLVDSEVAKNCRKFLIDSVQEDGSWPIDTNLATWVTSLAIHGLLPQKVSTSKTVSGFEDVALSDLQVPFAYASGSDNGDDLRGPSRTLQAQADMKIEPTAVAAVSNIHTIAETIPEASAFDSLNSSSSSSSPPPLLESGAKSTGEEEYVPVGDLIRVETIQWLLSCQHRVRHPFTGAEPGGWGWTNLSGAVPDADDTPAALLALHAWTLQNNSESMSKEILPAVRSGIQWLLKLQNRDGGWPTFCRGWGKLPFDRSGADLTAHAIRALVKWSNPQVETTPEASAYGSLNSILSTNCVESAIRRGLKYLRKKQRPDGSWLPLWFGNQDREEEENAIYGTGRVLLAFGDLQQYENRIDYLRYDDLQCAARGIEFLVSQQNADGGWGGGISVRYQESKRTCDPVDDRAKIVSSIEETSVAIEGLSACRSLLLDRMHRSDPMRTIPMLEFERMIDRAVVWLTTKIKHGDCDTCQPIGFYFAKLWYYERLYPYVFAAAALNRIDR